MGYVDADLARNLDGKRSTTSYVFTLGRRPICWKSMVQSLVALSTIELEYMAVARLPRKHYGLRDWSRSCIFNNEEFSCIVTVRVSSFWQRN